VDVVLDGGPQDGQDLLVGCEAGVADEAGVAGEVVAAFFQLQVQF